MYSSKWMMARIGILFLIIAGNPLIKFEGVVYPQVPIPASLIMVHDSKFVRIMQRSTSTCKKEHSTKYALSGRELHFKREAFKAARE